MNSVSQPEDLSRWGKNNSLWLETTPETDFPAAGAGPAVDVAVVGGGIAGMQAAYSLMQEGLRVAVIDAQRIVRDVTGFTTGKLTAQHGPIYQDLIANMDADRARLYADANLAALEKTAGIVAAEKIECDFKRTPSFLVTENEASLPVLRQELEACRSLGMDVSFVEETPAGYTSAVRLENQAQWHPRKYLLELARRIVDSGNFIYENTRVLDHEEGDEGLVLLTDKGQFRAANMVIATNKPFYRPELFAPILTGIRSYVLAMRLKGEVPEGVYYSIDETAPSLRNQPVDDGVVFMVGCYSGDFKIYETARQYEVVEKYAREHFDVASIDYNWFTQDQQTPDGVALIGPMPGEKNVYVTAGYNAWGMTSSGVSAMILTDLIAGRHNPWAALYDPARLIKD